MDAKEVFLAAYTLISDPEKWTQGHYARDQFGNASLLRGPEAVCWCSQGAILKCGEGGAVDIVLEKLTEAAPEVEGLDALVALNDGSPHATVLAHWRAVGEREGWL